VSGTAVVWRLGLEYVPFDGFAKTFECYEVQSREVVWEEILAKDN